MKKRTGVLPSTALAPWRKARAVYIEATKTGPGPVAETAPAGRQTLIRSDSGGGTHELVAWLAKRGRWLSYSVGMTITDAIHHTDADGTRLTCFATNTAGEAIAALELRHSNTQPEPWHPGPTRGDRRAVGLPTIRHRTRNGLPTPSADRHERPRPKLLPFWSGHTLATKRLSAVLRPLELGAP